MCNIVFIDSMPVGSYDSVGMMECEISDNHSYPNLNVYKEAIESKNDFKVVVASLVEQVSKETKLVLHLCVHGNENGIAFKGYNEANPSDEYYMLWDEFIQNVKPLNDALGCNLILVLQACFSSSLSRKMTGCKFCKCLIAGEGGVRLKDVSPFLQFYKILSQTQDAKLAYEAMGSTKYYDVKHNEIQVSSVYSFFQNDEIYKG